LLWGALDPLDQAVFQSVFGDPEPPDCARVQPHPPVRCDARQSVIQIKSCCSSLCSALARKFIVLDLHEVAAANCWGSPQSPWRWASSNWLMRERDDRLAGASKRDPK